MSDTQGPPSDTEAADAEEEEEEEEEEAEESVGDAAPVAELSGATMAPGAVSEEALSVPVEPVAVLPPKQRRGSVTGMDSPTSPEDQAVAAWLRVRLAKQRSPDAWRVSFHGLEDGDRGLKMLAVELPKGLVSLEVELPRSCSPTDVGVRRFAQRLERLPGLARLMFRCAMCEKITDAGVEALCRSLHALHLEELTLDFGLCTQLADDTAFALASFLAAIGAEEFQKRRAEDAEGQEEPHLRRVDLNLHGCTGLTDKGLSKLGHEIGQLRHVAFLAVNIAEMSSSVTGQGIQPILRAVQNLKDLEHLSVVLQDCEAMQESSLVLFCQALREKPSLKVLHLNFHGCVAITSAGLVLFNEVFKEMPAIESVTLDVTNCDKVADKGVEEFCSAVKPRRHLQSVVLHVGGTGLTQNALPLLNKMMGELKTFKVSTKISAKGFTGVSVTFK